MMGTIYECAHRPSILIIISPGHRKQHLKKGSQFAISLSPLTIPILTHPSRVVHVAPPGIIIYNFFSELKKTSLLFEHGLMLVQAVNCKSSLVPGSCIIPRQSSCILFLEWSTTLLAVDVHCSVPYGERPLPGPHPFKGSLETSELNKEGKMCVYV